MPSNLDELYLHKNITGGRATDENRWGKSGLELNVPFFSFPHEAEGLKGFVEFCEAKVEFLQLFGRVWSICISVPCPGSFLCA